MNVRANVLSLLPFLITASALLGLAWFIEILSINMNKEKNMENRHTSTISKLSIGFLETLKTIWAGGTSLVASTLSKGEVLSG